MEIKLCIKKSNVHYKILIFFVSISKDQLDATLINLTRKEYGCKCRGNKLSLK
jgi:hypothetical protein